MKPGLGIGILAPAGALKGLALHRWIGWPGTGTGAVRGTLVGTVLCAPLQEKK